jgi:hypothetical protein
LTRDLLAHPWLLVAYDVNVQAREHRAVAMLVAAHAGDSAAGGQGRDGVLACCGRVQDWVRFDLMRLPGVRPG